MQDIFIENNLKLQLRPYEIIVTSPNSGLLEFIPDSMSIDSIK
jgi:phosphatidylinositol 4-kinase